MVQRPRGLRPGKLSTMSRRQTERPVVGWREWVKLPGLCEAPLKAKVDTGARTSALHAFDLDVVEVDGLPYARFEIHPVQRSRRAMQEVAVPVVGYRRVRSSSGHSAQRPVIRVPIEIGAERFQTEITLTARDEMGFRMLLGRSALRRRYVVDVARSYVQSSRPEEDT